LRPDRAAQIPYARILFVLCGAFIMGRASMAQGSSQLWMDGILGKTFEGIYRADAEFGYRTLVSSGSNWESFRLAPRMEAAPTAHWTFLLGAPFIFTDQQEGGNTFEARVQVGAKYNFTPFRRVQSRLNLRYEFRSVEDEGEDLRQNSQRLRIRAEVVVPLDTDNYRADTMWYAMADAEAFLSADQDVDERFANRARVRVGAGRKFSYNWRMELIYTVQQSRNSIEDADPSVDNILRLRFKYYFTPRVRRAELEHHAN
jgi:hypothetical protein